jgi:hypothetical protein
MLVYAYTCRVGLIRSMSPLQVNVHSALKTNAKIIADWKELVDRLGLAEK